MRLTVATFNFQDGGWSTRHGGYQFLTLLPEVISQIPDVDVLFLQEARAFDFDGHTALYQAEQLLAPIAPLRGFLTRSRSGLLHQVVFLRWPRLRPLRHYVPEAPDTFHDQVGFLHTHLDGMDQPLLLKSLHWPNESGDARLHEALRLTGRADPQTATILAGDTNTLWPGEQEFEPDWLARLPHQRLHKTLPPGARPDGHLASDRRALTVLAEAGFVNAGCAAGDYTVTVNAHVDDGQGARIDHILASPWLGQFLVPDSYRVWVNNLGDWASDHRLVTARFDLPPGPW